MSLSVGERMPEFSLPSQSGELVDNSALVGKPLVIYFYPKDETMICTRESCGFRDSYEAFRAVGADVIGISSDSVESHRGFAAHHRLPFRLLSDVGGTVRKLFGVPRTLGLIPGRVTYVFDAKGIVRHVFSSQFTAQGHIQEALRALKEWGSG
jgi:peroxiredoxin Q/BCP